MDCAKNSLGRSTGRKFNMAAIKRDFLAKQLASEKKALTFDEKFEAMRIKRDRKPIVINFGGVR